MKSNQIYQSLLDDLRHCRQKGLNFIEEVECCFHISEDYWKMLRKELLCFQFLSDEEEIHFFKVVKPQFIAEIEYYRHLYDAIMFCPDNDEIAIKQFWEVQVKRLDKFVNLHCEFYTYYKDGCTRLDERYFLRKFFDPDLAPGIKYHQPDPRTDTTHDYLAGMLIALERYRLYIKEKLKELEKKL